MAACREELTVTVLDLEQMHYYVLVEKQGIKTEIEDDNVAGFYGLHHEGNNVYELTGLFIEPEFIGKGYGKQLIKHATQTAKGLGATQLVIQSDPNATGFYIKAGGRKTGQLESGSIKGRFLPTFSITISGDM